MEMQRRQSVDDHSVWAKPLVKPLKVAVGQLCSNEQVEKNQEQIQNLLSKVDSDCDLVVFPENSLYQRVSSKHLEFGFDLNDEAIMAIRGWVDDHQTSVILGSIPLKLSAGIGNSMILLEPGSNPKAVYQKIHLFDVDVPGAPPVRESNQFVHGESAQVIEVKGWKLGLSICYDLRFSDLYWHYSSLGVDAILVPSAFLVPTGKAHWHVLLRARAIENQCYVIAPAQGGEHHAKDGKKRETFGHSLVVDPWGEVLIDLKTHSPSIEHVLLDPQERTKVQSRIPMHQHRSWKPPEV